MDAMEIEAIVSPRSVETLDERLVVVDEQALPTIDVAEQ
jgi:hypothetical protein